MADPALDGVDKLVHLTWHKGGDVHRRIPASGALQSRVVAGIPVTEEMLDPPLQKVGVRPSPMEHRHLVTIRYRQLHKVTPNERRPTENQQAHPATLRNSRHRHWLGGPKGAGTGRDWRYCSTRQNVAIDVGQHDRARATGARFVAGGAQREEAIERRLRARPSCPGDVEVQPPLPDLGISGGPLQVIFGPVPSGAWIAVSSS